MQLQEPSFGRRATAYAPGVLLGFAVVLPPKYLAAVMVLVGAGAVVYLATGARQRILNTNDAIVAGLLVASSLFCALGMLPITQKTDIQFEFLKYGVYAASFLAGLAFLSRRESLNGLLIAVLSLVLVFFVMSAAASTGKFHVFQSWLLYPPDQNNSSSILAPLAVSIVFMKRPAVRFALLLLLFVFFVFVESRFGIIVIAAVVLTNVFADRRWGIALVVACLLIGGGLSLSKDGAQLVMVREVHSLSEAPSSSASLPAARLTKPQDDHAPVFNSIVQFGKYSDNLRIKIYERALEIAAGVFPNLIGLGDARVIALLNSPPLDPRQTFQHTHNVVLQSYLAYGLLATICLVAAFVALAVVAIRRRNWRLLGMLAILGSFGMIEALISDIRVLAILLMAIGGEFAMTNGQEFKSPTVELT